MFQLEEAEEAKDYMRKELLDLKRTVSTMHKEIVIKSNEIEVLQDKVSYFKHKNKLIEGEIANKTEEISSLKENSECKIIEEKASRLEAVSKNKTEILLTVLKEKQ